MTRPWRIPDPSRPPGEAAAAAFLRLTSGEATEAEVAAIRAWLAADPGHKAAYDAVHGAWHGIGPLAPLPWAANDRPVRRRPSKAALAALAAGMVGVVVLIGLERSAADIRTRPGEVREVALPDGGRAWLDTDSAIDLAYGADTRQVTVLKGQAWFDVADEARPFVVRTHDATITDIGTVFGVRRDGDATRVYVREGEVRVSCADAEAAVLPGAMAACTRGGLAERGAADIAAVSGWQDGRLSFIDRPLREILREIDRYSPGLTFVRLPPDVARRRVTAYLELERLEAGLEALAASEGLTISRVGPATLVRKNRRLPG